jgi:hypothetical protein
LAATYADVENHALQQDEVLVGTPGSISVRQNGTGTRYYVRQYYDFDGRKRDQYLGQVDAPDSDAAAEAWRKRIDEARDLQRTVRLLAREGYLTLSAKHLAALSPLTRPKVFEAGAVLVGTHAFEVIANRMGIRVAAFATEDVDVARPGKLALAKPLGVGLLDLLHESGNDFIELPHSRYLLGETQMGAAISAHGVAAVRVPLPERFALHKLVVSQLRTGRAQKSLKDMQQASVLIAAMGELFPGALEEVYRKAPVSCHGHLRKSLEQLRSALEVHPRSWEEVATAAKI